MNHLVVCFVAVAFGGAAVEALIGLGGCPNQPVVNNFVAGTFAGTWYEYGRYLTPRQITSGCTRVAYTPKGSLIDIESESVTLGLTGSVKGQMKKADPSKSEAKFTVSFFENAFEGRENDRTAVNFQILDTDYTSYAIGYNCVNLILFHFTDLIIYTRDRTPDQQIIDEVYDELQDRRIATFTIARTNQNNCDN